MKSFKIHFKLKQEKSNVKAMLVVLKWPTLQDRMKTARITMLQKITAGNGTTKVACGHLQQLPLYHYQPKPEEDRTKKKITSNESPEEKTPEITVFFPRTIRDWYNSSLPPSQELPLPLTQVTTHLGARACH